MRIRLNYWTISAVLLVTIAVIMRVHNSIVYPVPKGYDSFGHVMYIWYLIKTRRLPLASEGWSFFHPPLFFVSAAVMWRALRQTDPVRVMHLISLVFALIGLLPAWITYVIVRQYLGGEPTEGAAGNAAVGGRRLALLCAPAFMLFLPVCIYTAPMIGNEGLHAVLCAVGIYCLLRTVKCWTIRWAATLGAVLGLAFLTKFTASGLILASAIVIAAVGWHRGSMASAARLLLVTLAVAFAISGWFYIRNIVIFGNPFQMSRDFFFVQRIENYQLQTTRTLHDYFSFDTSIFRLPSMFRGPGEVIRSVWTGIFANTWFDAFGGWFTPSAQDNMRVRVFGGLILLLAVVPTLLVVLGIGTAVLRLLRQGWEDTLITMLVIFVLIVGMYMQYTRSVPIYSAIKASYLLPITVIFGFWFGLGVSALAGFPRLRALLTAEMCVLVAAIVAVFWYGALFELQTGPLDQNARGVICYLAGFRDRAADLFEVAARDRLYLAHENLATVALDVGDPYRALGEMLWARQLVPRQTLGVGEDRPRQIRLAMGDYENTLAYIYDRLGWQDEAVRAAREAARNDPTLVEAYYNQAVLLLKTGEVSQAAETLPRTLELDPGFIEARALKAVVDALQGDCPSAVSALQALDGSISRRRFPHETGRGDITDAGLERHKIIDDLPFNAQPSYALALCGGNATGRVTDQR